MADLTTRRLTGGTYAASIIDVFSRAIVGWPASTSLRSDVAIEALDYAPDRVREGLLCHQRARQSVRAGDDFVSSKPVAMQARELGLIDTQIKGWRSFNKG